MWHDLTVENAETVSEFYKAVIGWEKEAMNMGTYNDYVMKGTEPADAVGVCHARGGNKDIPPQWLLYVTVDDLDKSLESCTQLGGKILGDKRKMGEEFYCLIQDPAGAYMMLCGK